MTERRIARLIAFYLAALEQGRSEGSSYIMSEAAQTLDELQDALEEAGYLRPFRQEDGSLRIW